MKIVNCIILFLFLSNLGNTQTIINAERLIGGQDSTIYALAFSYSGTKGNSNTDQFKISPSFVLLKEKHEYKLFGAYSLLSDSDKRILESGFFHLRHNFKLTNRIKTFEFYQLQFNEVLLLSKREVYGGGIKFNLLKRDSTAIDFSTGLMREIEFLNEKELLPDEISRTKYYRATFVKNLKWKINETVSIHNVLYYQPYLKDFNDYRLLNEFNLIVSTTKHLEFLTSLTTRYDSKPPGDLKKFDNVMSVGLNVKF